MKKKLILTILTFVAIAGNVFATDANNRGQTKLEISAKQTTALSQNSSKMLISACENIYSGNFEAAAKIVDGVDPNSLSSAAKLKEILNKYNEIKLHRDKSDLETYAEQIEELNKLQRAADANGLDDINDVISILVVAIKVNEYAPEEKKGQILEERLVKDAIGQAIVKAQEHEENGDWLEALVQCYSFLSALDKENEQWKEHQKLLTDLAIIKASLSDNPCEASANRHEGIKKEMFIRAIMVLDYNYVTAVNYSEMVKAALERCKKLATVLSKTDPNESLESLTFETDPDILNIWKSKIDKKIIESEQRMAGITRDKFISIFKEVLELNSKTMKLNEEVLIAQFSEAALTSLDPHTTLVWPWYVRDFQKSMKSEFSGVGIEISKADGPLKVNSLLPDTPAYNSGMDAGDIIEAVNGELTKDMTIECAVRKITGPEGTPVVLTVRHPKEDQSRDIKIVRAKIKVPTIRSWQRKDKGEWENIIDKKDKIGYVRITSFTSEETSSELEKQLNQLEAQGMRGLIIDLRFNSGGYLNQAVEIVDKFIDEGKLIVSTRPRLGSFPAWEISTKAKHPDYPLVILINGQSASASEIVAGALQDKAYKRAILVGSQSYGKGSVQTIVGYPGDGAQLKYTMAYYHLPSGQRVKGRYERKKLDKTDWGVSPDVEVELTAKEIRELYNIQRDNAVLVGKEHDKDDPVKRHTLEESIQADPQLGVAILVVKAKLAEKELYNHLAKAQANNNN